MLRCIRMSLWNESESIQIKPIRKWIESDSYGIGFFTVQSNAWEGDEDKT